MDLTGWVELGGQKISEAELEEYISKDSSIVTRLGGEFFIRYNSCCARDHYGIIPGPCPPGTILCGDSEKGVIQPDCIPVPLADAIRTAVSLRSDTGVTALSGGVDSALVAVLAGLPCIVVGMKGCHDIKKAQEVAQETGLSLHVRTVTGEEIEEALPRVIRIVGDPNPVDIAIATTLYFVAETAKDLGHTRILTGQGADEVFGGYARYLETPPDRLADLFAADFATLSRQGNRDQRIAASFGRYLSMPYLDVRVVTAAGNIPPGERVKDGIRKKPLREVAEIYLPKDIAYMDKKAMQYGTGIWKEIKRIAKSYGYQRSVTEFLEDLKARQKGDNLG